MPSPRLSDLSYGTWRLLDDDSSPPPAAELSARIELCLDLGITTIDTAEIYGGYRVEQTLGRALKSSPGLRDRVEIVSKCGIDVPSTEKGHARVNHYNATAENLVHCAEKSLSLLHTDHLDLFLVHRPDWLAPADETAEGLTRLLREGKILHAGVSNYSVPQFDLLDSRMETPLVTNQVELSLLAMAAIDDGTLNDCERRRIRPMAWSPLAGGRLFDPKNEAAARVRQCMEEIRPRYQDAADDTLAIAWVMAHPSRPVTVIGTNKPERIRSAAQAGSIKLDRQDWYALWQAARGHSVP